MDHPLVVASVTRVHDILVDARTNYPLELMVFYLMIQAQRFGQDNPVREPYNLLGLISRFVLSYVCYAFPGSIVIESLLLGRIPVMMCNLHALAIWGVLFLIIQYDLFKLPSLVFSSRPVLFFCKFIFAADVTRVGFNMLEAADVHYSRGSTISPKEAAHTRFPFILWAALIFASCPAILKAVFYGQHNFWRYRHSQQSFLLGNFQLLIQLFGFAFYFLYATRFSRSCSNGLAPLLSSSTFSRGGTSSWASSFSSTMISGSYSAETVVKVMQDGIALGHDIAGGSLSKCSEADPSVYVKSVLVVVFAYFLADLVVLLMGGGGGGRGPPTIGKTTSTGSSSSNKVASSPSTASPTIKKRQ